MRGRYSYQIYEFTKYVEWTCARACAELRWKGNTNHFSKPEKTPKYFPSHCEIWWWKDTLSKTKQKRLWNMQEYFLIKVEGGFNRNMSELWVPFLMLQWGLKRVFRLSYLYVAVSPWAFVIMTAPCVQINEAGYIVQTTVSPVWWIVCRSKISTICLLKFAEISLSYFEYVKVLSFDISKARFYTQGISYQLQSLYSKILEWSI